MSRFYREAREAFEYLETLAELEDQVEIDASRLDLMRNPTKALAADMYGRCIALWMGAHFGAFDHVERVRDIHDDFCA